MMQRFEGWRPGATYTNNFLRNETLSAGTPCLREGLSGYVAANRLSQILYCGFGTVWPYDSFDDAVAITGALQQSISPMVAW